jgi:hypothetical protein
MDLGAGDDLFSSRLGVIIADFFSDRVSPRLVDGCVDGCGDGAKGSWSMLWLSVSADDDDDSALRFLFLGMDLWAGDDLLSSRLGVIIADFFFDRVSPRLFDGDGVELSCSLSMTVSSAADDDAALRFLLMAIFLGAGDDDGDLLSSRLGVIIADFFFDRVSRWTSWLSTSCCSTCNLLNH